MESTDQLVLVTGSSATRTAAVANHRIYADLHGLRYVADATPSAVDPIYLHKVEVVRRWLPTAEWLFWIDDDAFFTDLAWDVRSLIREADTRDLVFCASPVNPQGGWTWMSSGQFLMRRSDSMLALLDAVLATDLAAVKATWDAETFGMFTRGDQDAFVHHLTRPGSPWAESFVRLPWEAFNSRPYHYASRLDEHRICHFAVPGGLPKSRLVLDFAERLGTTAALVDADRLEPFRTFLERSDMWRYLDGPGWRGTADEVAPKPSSGAAGGGSGPKAGAPAGSASLARRVRRRIGRSLGG